MEVNYKDIICIVRTLWSPFLIIFLSYIWHLLRQPWTYVLGSFSFMSTSCPSWTLNSIAYLKYMYCL